MFNHIQYLRNVTQHFTDFATPGQHFTRASGIGEIEELLMKMKDVKNYIIVAIDSLDGSAGDNRNDVYLDTQHFRFYILKKTKLNDFDARETELKNIKAIGKKIIYKMREDKRSARNGLLFLEIDRIPYITVGPLADGYIGIEFFFNLVEKLFDGTTTLTADENF